MTQNLLLLCCQEGVELVYMKEEQKSTPNVGVGATLSTWMCKRRFRYFGLGLSSRVDVLNTNFNHAGWRVLVWSSRTGMAGLDSAVLCTKE